MGRSGLATRQKPLAGEELLGSLDQIRAGLSIHLQLISLAIERLQLNHHVIRYESLVAQPEASLRGCLDAMQLPIPITLSQAREPI